MTDSGEIALILQASPVVLTPARIASPGPLR